jgi:alpha-galactosidase
MYQDTVINPGLRLPAQFTLINGTLEERIVLELDEAIGTRQLEIRNCRGQVIRTEHMNLSKGLHLISVPAAGLATLRSP